MEQTYRFNQEGLTKKNLQYIVDVERHLRTAAVLPEDQIVTLIDTMVTDVKEAQKKVLQLVVFSVKHRNNMLMSKMK